MVPFCSPGPHRTLVCLRHYGTRSGLAHLRHCLARGSCHGFLIVPPTLPWPLLLLSVPRKGAQVNKLFPRDRSGADRTSCRERCAEDGKLHERERELAKCDRLEKQRSPKLLRHPLPPFPFVGKSFHSVRTRLFVRKKRVRLVTLLHAALRAPYQAFTQHTLG
jgi:hypothetical protein